MNTYRAHQQYQKTQVETANPTKLVIMLYEGGIKFLKLAKKHIKNQDIEKAHNNIIRAQDIILELMSSLDLEKGDTIAQNLYSLYEYMNRQLIKANTKKDIDPINEVIVLLDELLDSWKQISDSQGLISEEQVNS